MKKPDFFTIGVVAFLIAITLLIEYFSCGGDMVLFVKRLIYLPIAILLALVIAAIGQDDVKEPYQSIAMIAVFVIAAIIAKFIRNF
ncbi:MAG TPA: hypothetical protein GX736_01345 [Mogibacterium sp.]|nr:hypothetical protein [Mogibacterium sp.]